MYHPDYQPSWFERLGELFHVDRPDPDPPGADLTLLRRAAVRDVQAFVDGRFGVRQVGPALVRVDSNLRLPDDPVARRATCGNIVRRLRVVELTPRHPEVPARSVIQDTARWYQFQDVGGGTSLVVRLLHAARWSVYLSVDLSTGPDPRWTYPDLPDEPAA